MIFGLCMQEVRCGSATVPCAPVCRSDLQGTFWEDCITSQDMRSDTTLRADRPADQQPQVRLLRFSGPFLEI